MENLKKNFKNAEKSTHMILCLNTGSVAKLVAVSSEFHSVTSDKG